MGYRFLDSHNAASDKQLRVKAGSYSDLFFRFNIDQAAGQQVNTGDLGSLKVFYHGVEKQNVKFSELQYLNNLKFGAVEDVDGGAGAIHTLGFRLPVVHWLDYDSAFFVANDIDFYVEWQPATTLAAKVDTLSLRLLGGTRLGKTTHILAMKRKDISMVAGDTRPEQLFPYNVAQVYVEYNTNINYLQIDADGRTEVQNLRIAEALDISLLNNKIETYSTSGAYAEIDLMDGQHFSDVLLARALNNDVEIMLNGSSADTISVFWTMLDFQVAELAKTEALYRQAIDQRLAAKAAAGGSAAVSVYSVEASRNLKKAV